MYAGYVRVSAVGDRGGDRFHSPEQQQQAIRALAERLGVQVEILPAELNRSGGDDTRPILARAVQGVEDGTYAGILAAYLSRLARSTRMTLDVLRRVEAAGGRVITAQEGEAAGTPDGRFMTTIHAAVAQAERERHSERFHALNAHVVQRGVWRQRQTPLGYRRGPDRRLEVEPDQAERVRAAFAARASGASLVDAARILGRSPSGARALLRNRVYLGELRLGEHVNPSAHEPIVETGTWRAAQVSPRAPRSPARNPPALLAGLARCGSCGHALTRARNGAMPAYLCQSRSSGRPCPAPPAIVERRLDDWVLDLVSTMLDERAQMLTPGSSDAQARRDRAALEDAQRELDAYVEAVSAADVGARVFAEGARSRRERVEAAQERLERRDVVRGMPQMTGAAFRAFTHAGQGRMLRTILEAVVVWPSGRGRVVAVGERSQALLAGAGVAHSLRRGGGIPAGVRSIPRLLDDDPRVARLLREDGGGLHGSGVQGGVL